MAKEFKITRVYLTDEESIRKTAITLAEDYLDKNIVVFGEAYKDLCKIKDAPLAVIYDRATKSALSVIFCDLLTGVLTIGRGSKATDQT